MLHDLKASKKAYSLFLLNSIVLLLNTQNRIIMVAKFLGFLVFVVIASAAFFVPVSLGLIAPIALKPKKEEEEAEEEVVE